MTSIPSHDALPFDLEALAAAHGYQAWIHRAVRPFVGRRILEFGAGIGAMSRLLADAERLILLEPDARLRAQLEERSRAWRGGARISVHALALPGDSLRSFEAERLDTVVSFNVLEHIEDDRAALAAVAELLRRSEAPGPRRIVSFVPAHPFAFGSLDEALVHFRRYSRSAFAALARTVAPEASLRMRSFNFLGLWAWCFSGRIRRLPRIDPRSVAAFERLLPLIRLGDALAIRTLRLPLGQSLIAVLEWPPRSP